MHQQAKDAFAHITGLPLTNTTRSGLVQFFHFGSTHYTTPQGLVLDVGAFTLAVNCPWQLHLPDGESITDKEVYLRKREAGLPNPAAAFDWKVPGATLRDQRLKELVNKNEPLLAAETVAGTQHSLTIRFSNGMKLSLSPDPEAPDTEYWHFFSNPDQRISVKAGLHEN